mmetsp:Transcript_22615/g.70865  ORF Transcript_22615/g.70865 Transcript_22615/m.70865 type:complete len:233 (-) Transcript_22615:533-1231(-)
MAPRESPARASVRACCMEATRDHAACSAAAVGSGPWPGASALPTPPMAPSTSEGACIHAAPTMRSVPPAESSEGPGLEAPPPPARDGPLLSHGALGSRPGASSPSPPSAKAPSTGVLALGYSPRSAPPGAWSGQGVAASCPTTAPMPSRRRCSASAASPRARRASARPARAMPRAPTPGYASSSPVPSATPSGVRGLDMPPSLAPSLPPLVSPRASAAASNTCAAPCTSPLA